MVKLPRSDNARVVQRGLLAPASRFVRSRICEAIIPMSKRELSEFGLLSTSRSQMRQSKAASVC